MSVKQNASRTQQEQQTNTMLRIVVEKKKKAEQEGKEADSIARAETPTDLLKL